MTLKEAFKGRSGNCPKLAARYRSEFKHVFLSEHGKDDVRQFTEFYVRVLMEHNKSIPYVKTRTIMKTTNVAIVNGISLQVVSSEREQLVAVKPVCEILGVAYPPQFTKLKEHPIFGSVITLSVTTGTDGKEYEMACIPLRYFPSWLFSINLTTDDISVKPSNQYNDNYVFILRSKYIRKMNLETSLKF